MVVWTDLDFFLEFMKIFEIKNSKNLFRIEGYSADFFLSQETP